MRLLLIEDSSRLRDLISETIHNIGWRIDAVDSLRQAEEAEALVKYDLLLVDLGMPDGDGLDFIRQLRRNGSQVPVLVITARVTVEDRIIGLDVGADDYLTKPFNHGELLARCRAMLRRSPVSSLPVIEFGPLRYDPSISQLQIDGQPQALPPRERALIEVLLRDAGRVVPKKKLEAKFSEFGEEMSTNALELVVSRLRKKLELVSDRLVIETVRGVGYLLRETGGTET